MTFTAAPWGLDGARSPASLARLANRAAVKQSGIINPGDLKVLPLSTPGNGVRIGVGGGVIENRYISNSGQAYVVESTAETILTSADNFTGITSQGSTKHHLICVTVGDPNYSTAGHAWLTDVNKPANPTAALDYQYVRPWVIQNVPLGTSRVEDLPSPPAYPTYAVARIEVPASTTAITSGMIVDLREVVNPRQKLYQWNGIGSDTDALDVAFNTYEYFPNNSDRPIYIPAWATACYVEAWIQGLKDIGSDDTRAVFRLFCQTANFGTGGSKYLNSSIARMAVLIGDKISIPSNVRGTTQNWQIQGSPQDAASQGDLTTDVWTNYHVSLRFVEEAV